MRFHANYVSTSVLGDGDYYQAMFQAEQDTDDLDSPYLLIQRQFEDADDHRCYIETHDETYCGHFRLRRVDFAPQKLSIELDRIGRYLDHGRRVGEADGAAEREPS
jgi:hypothetical protein